MTTLLLDGIDRVAASSVWSRVTDDLWAASDRDGFLGTVELVAPGRYAATDGRGGALGATSTLHAAQALVTSQDPAATQTARRTRVTLGTAWVAGLCAMAGLAMLLFDVTH